MIATLLFTSILVLADSNPSTMPVDAKPAAAPRELYDRVAPSLVIIRYTYDGDAGRRDLEGEGVVIDDTGLVVCSSGVTPAGIPDVFFKDFKIVIPGDDETELDATLLGRDDRSNLTFVRVKDAASHKWSPIHFVDGGAANVGDSVYSVGLLPKGAGYKAYLAPSTVAATLRGPVPQVLVAGGGLATVGSPVFNAAGQAIGVVEAQVGQSPIFNPESTNDLAGVTVPPHAFVPAGDFLKELANPPTAGKPLEIPWIGIAEMTGLKKDVAEYYGLKKDPAAQVGDVIPDAPSAKAGIKAGDVIVQYNGKPLERGDSPDESWMIMTREISRLAVGDKITLGIISEKGAAPREVSVTLEARPKPPSQAKRFLADDLGFAVRDIVFDDTYERRLPSTTPGVVVAFVKNSSSAAAAHLSSGRDGQDLITQFNGQPVKDVDDFKTKYELMRKDKPKEAIVLEVMRGANTQVIRIEPPQ